MWTALLQQWRASDSKLTFDFDEQPFYILPHERVIDFDRVNEPLGISLRRLPETESYNILKRASLLVLFCNLARHLVFKALNEDVISYIKIAIKSSSNGSIS